MGIITWQYLWDISAFNSQTNGCYPCGLLYRSEIKIHVKLQLNICTQQDFCFPKQGFALMLSYIQLAGFQKTLNYFSWKVHSEQLPLSLVVGQCTVLYKHCSVAMTEQILFMKQCSERRRTECTMHIMVHFHPCKHIPYIKSAHVVKTLWVFTVCD